MNCTFVNCSFFETSFAECKLLGSTFDRCTFDLMRVNGGNWAHAGLAGSTPAGLTPLSLCTGDEDLDLFAGTAECSPIAGK